MTTMTMPTTTERAAAPINTKHVGHLMPLLVALVLFVAAAVVSVLISGPMH